MFIKRSFWGVIGCLILCSPLFSCPSNVSIKTALDEGDVSKFYSLIEELQDCHQWYDSLGLIYHQLGVIHHHGQNLDSAIIYAEKALSVRQEFYQNKPHLHLGKSYNNLGIFYKKEGEYLLAKFNLQKAISIFEVLDERDRLRYSQYELSWIYGMEGDFQKSETLLNFLIDSSLPEENWDVADYLVALSNNYREQKKYDLAESALKRAIRICEEGKFHETKASAYTNIGALYYSLGQYEEAIIYDERAIDILRAFDNCAELAQILNQKGLAFLRNKEIFKARNSIEEGLAVAQSCYQDRIIAQSHDNLGELYLSTQQYKEANASFSQALQALLPLLATQTSLNNQLEEELQQSSFKIDLLIYLSDKTRALKALYKQDNIKKHLQEALQYLEIGDYLIDQLRQNHNDQSTKLFWRQEVLPFYEKAIELCTLLDDPNKAFFYFEKSKSILLLEALLSSNALQSIPDSLQRNVKQLERQIRLNRHHINELKGKENANKLKTILDLEEKLDTLNLLLSRQYPQLNELKQENQVIDLQIFTNNYLKNKNRTIVHYFYGKEHVYALVANEKTQQVIHLGKSEEMTTLVRDYLQYFEQADRIESQPQAYLQQAAKVYTALVKPLNLPAQTELLIIPAGILTYLPFEALVTENGTDFGMANAPYMLLRHPLWFGFSATLFDQIEQRTLTANQKSLLAFAPFANTSSETYPALSFSQDELSNISQFVPIDLYSDQHATLDVFLANQANYDVLHLSTHAFSSFSETQPYIVFSDSVLNLADLYQHHIPANLVVLSACQTQIGKLAEGEGVLGLSRGFFYAGARSVVSSLWNMNAKSTSIILSDFYEGMSKNEPKYLALSQAKTAYLQDENIPSFQKSPYYWAGMSYYGDSDRWSVETPIRWWKYALILLAIVGLGMAYKRFY